MSIYGLVKEALDKTELDSAREIAEWVAKNIDRDDPAFDDIFETAIYSQVTTILSNLRKTANRLPMKGPGSSKWDAAAANVLRSRICIVPGLWKQLGECEIGDIESASMNRQEMADNIMAQSQAFADLALYMKKKKAKKVKQLDVEKIVEIVGSEHMRALNV